MIFFIIDPYSKCKDNLAELNIPLVDKILKTGYKYRQRDCFFVCFQKYMIPECKCTDTSAIVSFDESVEPCLNIAQIFCDFEQFLKFYSQNVEELCSNEW
jgi:hypothetical protein